MWINIAASNSVAVDNSIEIILACPNTDCIWFIAIITDEKNNNSNTTKNTEMNICSW